ncbi:hypothetical protein [Alkalibaculum bacchi]|uniref:hypothetical protein n=1 Tax=Alkalibaculum bacchi TaxID=645887 RepID=UPI0026EDC3B5|nr:hypothetical protein [Alkalibaculum bacchi]
MISVYLSKGVLVASLKELTDYSFDFVKVEFQLSEFRIPLSAKEEPSIRNKKTPKKISGVLT